MLIEKLRQAATVLNEKHTFNAGDIVEWKPGMKHKKSEGPFIVIEVLSDPVIDTEEGSGSPYFRERLDVICGQIHEERLIALHYDSRRFQPYSG